jgi:hypothetical protein
MSKYSAESGDDSSYFANQRLEEIRRAYARIERLERALREIQLHATEPLHVENRPGYELREFCEEIHAMAASALSSGEPIKNEASSA